ncbi:MAG: ABC transporter permease [Pseudomonadales bacterium]|nr:ABC transporter permease [Pseudomonadales bacterium]
MRSRTSWQIQKSVFFALFIRELKTRFGGYRLGILWALIEPIAHIFVLTILFGLIREQDGFYGVPFAMFFASGIISFFIFQKIIQVSINSIRINLGLFSYRQVKPFDAILIRSFLELIIIFSTAIFLIWFGAWFLNFNSSPSDPLKVLLIILLLFLFSLGAGFFVSVIGVLYEEASQLINIFMRPLYFVSGIFFPLEIMPKEYHIYLLWNPLLHAVEQFRAAWFSNYPAGETSLTYILIWSLSILLIGLAYYRKNRTRVLMS